MEANPTLVQAIKAAGSPFALSKMAALPESTLRYQIGRGYLGHREAYAVARVMKLNPDKLMEKAPG